MSTTHIHTHHHAVQFYGSEPALFATVAGFLSEGLIAGQPALVIATAKHRAGITKQLGKRLIDVDAARHSGRLVLLDAEDMLATFMVGDVPNPKAFERTIGGLVAETLGSHPGLLLRAYGEMVDLLWKRKRHQAAIQVELLWNQLAETHRFALLCGYAMGQFYKSAALRGEVCRQHTEVLAEAEVVPLERGRKATSG